MFLYFKQYHQNLTFMTMPKSMPEKIPKANLMKYSCGNHLFDWLSLSQCVYSFDQQFSARNLCSTWRNHRDIPGVVLHFGIKGTSDKEPMPPPKSCIVPKARRKINTVESHDEMIAETEDGESKDDEELGKEKQLLDPTPALLESIPPRPQDEAATQDWLKECSSTISKQLIFIVVKESA